MKENFLLMDNDVIINKCLASSINEAIKIFNDKGYVLGLNSEVISEADRLDEILLSQTESQIGELMSY